MYTKPNSGPALRRPAGMRLRPLSLALSAMLIAATISGVASAQSFPAVLNLSTLDGSNGFRLNGLAADDRLGAVVSAAGDINGDGIDDLIIGAANADSNGSNSGSSYVVFGKATAFDATQDLVSLTGANGFVITGAAVTDRSGTSVSAAGDINGDGIDDLLISAIGADPNGSYSGSTYVVFGKQTPFAASMNLGSLTGSNGFRLDGEGLGHRSGNSVSAAGDINGDGIDDLIIGAYRNQRAPRYAGSSYVVFGKTEPFAAASNLSALSGSDGFRLDGVAGYDFSGTSVSAAGDINGDGFDDLIIGAIGADPNGNYSGSSYVVFGKNTPFTAILALADLSGNNGFRLDGSAFLDSSGGSVSAAGDINGDGIDDLIIGAKRAGPNDSGSGYVVFGKTTPFAATLALASLSGNDGFRVDGRAPDDRTGGSASAAGDVNGDGIDDLIIGAYSSDANSSSSGSSFVVFGKNTPFAAVLNLNTLNSTTGVRIDGAAPNDTSGRWVSAAGDINADGTDDLVIGASWASPNGSMSGSSFVVFGRAAPMPTLSTSMSSLGFGSLSLGQTSPSQTLTLSNTGNANLVIGALTISGSHFADFDLSADTCSSQTLLPAANCTVSISFAPSQLGTRSAQLDIPSNAASSPDAVALSGEGLAQPTTASVSSQPSSSVVGQPYTVTATISGNPDSPTGSVLFRDGDLPAASSCGPVTLVPGTAPNSSASCELSSFSAGTRTLTAEYTPDSPNWAASSATSTHSVGPASTAISVSGPPRIRINTPTHFAFALEVLAPGAGTPNGVVTLSSAGSSCQVILPSALFSCELSFDLLGPRTVSAAFVNSDGNHLDAASSGAGNTQTFVYAQADLAVTKSDGVDQYLPGDLLVYTLSLRNLSGDTAVNLRLRDPVPPGLVNVQWSCSSISGPACPQTSGSGDLDANIPLFPVNSLLVYSYYGHADGNPAQIVNTVSVELPLDNSVEDPQLGNNSATDTNTADALLADGFEGAEVQALTGTLTLQLRDVLPKLDTVSQVVRDLHDANGPAARIYARSIGGQAQYALASRDTQGTLQLGAWLNLHGDLQLSWTANQAARGWVVDGVSVK